jgi:glycine/D-amino acid oxidase-like deaminating enzyme/nitrite reductase/ring-hydroxylating ferredoxin subunit
MTASNNPGPTDGATTSSWLEAFPAPELPRLAQDLHCDVCVIGAGIAGLTTAYLLALHGKRVVVLEQGTGVCAGQTGRTTAHLTCAFDDRIFAVEQLHGAEVARLVVDSHRAAIDEIEAISIREQIACDFRRVDGYLFMPPREDPEVLTRELHAARRAGLACELVTRAPLPFDTGRALRFPMQAQFQPIRYCAGLAAAIERHGGLVYGRTHVDVVEGGTPCRVQTEAGPVLTARAVVVATNSPVNDLGVVIAKMVPFRSYVIACRVPRGSVRRGLYWDAQDSYHYVRVEDGDRWDLLIVGGEDHKVGQWGDLPPELRWQRLESWARERFPVEVVVTRWSGQILEPVDQLAFIGRNPMDQGDVYVATGDSGNGLTHGTIAGMLLRDLITGRPSAWARIYDPARRTLHGKALGNLVRENANAVGQYRAWLGRGAGEAVAPGHGAVVRRGLHLVAVYVDDDGRRTECSAACPHMGGVVQWNDAERSWDCPLHGSRFDACGRVIEGPAIADLGAPEPARAPVPQAPTARPSSRR